MKDCHEARREDCITRARGRRSARARKVREYYDPSVSSLRHLFSNALTDFVSPTHSGKGGSTITGFGLPRCIILVLMSSLDDGRRFWENVSAKKMVEGKRRRRNGRKDEEVSMPEKDRIRLTLRSAQTPDAGMDSYVGGARSM